MTDNETDYYFNLNENFSSILEETIKEIPTLDSSIDYWLVRAKSGTYYTDFNVNNYVGIDWNSITLEDIISANNSSEAMKTILREKLPDQKDKKVAAVELPEDVNQDIIEKLEELIETPISKSSISENQYGIWAGQLLRFVNKLKINDVVVVPSESSELFLVGRISGPIYELTDKMVDDQEISKNYKKSNFKKRWPVEWWGYFDRKTADSALYKMIYSQATITNINDFKPFINRAIFPYYIEDDKLHLTFQVTQPSDIDSYYLGQFIYQYSKMANLLHPENKVDVKVNVQSEGVIELISSVATHGLEIFTVLSFGLVAPFGGKLKAFGHEIEVPGIAKGIQDIKANRTARDSQNLKNIRDAYELANELKVPISQLGIKIPKELQKTIDENIEKANLKKEDSPNSQSTENEEEPNV